MKNINVITKRFFNNVIEDACQREDEELLSYRQYYDENTANVFYISDFCMEYPRDVLDWIYSNDIIDEEKAERLAELICKKVDRDSSKWLRAKSESIIFRQ